MGGIISLGIPSILTKFFFECMLHDVPSGGANSISDTGIETQMSVIRRTTYSRPQPFYHVSLDDARYLWSCSPVRLSVRHIGYPRLNASICWNTLCVTRQSGVSTFEDIFRSSVFRGSRQTMELNGGTPCQKRQFEQYRTRRPWWLGNVRDRIYRMLHTGFRSVKNQWPWVILNCPVAVITRYFTNTAAFGAKCVELTDVKTTL